MKYLQLYESFVQPYKEVRTILVKSNKDPKVVIRLITDKQNRITDIRNPRGVRHQFRLGNILNKSVLDAWVKANDMTIAEDLKTKEKIKGHELIKLMSKRGY